MERAAAPSEDEMVEDEMAEDEIDIQHIDGALAEEEEEEEEESSAAEVCGDTDEAGGVKEKKDPQSERARESQTERQLERQ